jgi:hypothetical protein
VPLPRDGDARVRESEDWNPLASVFEEPDRDLEHTESVRKRIGTYSSRDMKGNVVMVTHNVNIASLTKLSVAPGEMVIVRPTGAAAFAWWGGYSSSGERSHFS